MGPFQIIRTREMVTPVEIVSNSAAQTRNIGMRLGKSADSGDIILLTGPLGAGKTCFTQGLAMGMGIREYTASPSFVLVREYEGKVPLYHIDLYRLDNIEEVAQLGLDDYLYGKGVCVVEWADKALSILPGEHLLIEIQFISLTRRKLSFVPRGTRYLKMVAKLKSEAAGARE